MSEFYHRGRGDAEMARRENEEWQLWVMLDLNPHP
jgi:hypothetical protein